jgi:hypothetical protein
MPIAWSAEATRCILLVAEPDVKIERVDAIEEAIEQLATSMGLPINVERATPGEWTTAIPLETSIGEFVRRHGSGETIQAKPLMTEICEELLNEGFRTGCLFLATRKTFLDDDGPSWGCSWARDLETVAARIRISLVSTLHYSIMLPERERLAMIRYVAQHEFGHVLGLVQRQGEGAYMGECKVKKEHCENQGCVMRQFMDLPHLKRFALEAILDERPLCAACVDEVGSRSAHSGEPKSEHDD